MDQGSGMFSDPKIQSYQINFPILNPTPLSGGPLADGHRAGALHPSLQGAQRGGRRPAYPGLEGLQNPGRLRR